MNPKLEVILNLCVTWIPTKGGPIGSNEEESYLSVQGSNLHLQWSQNRKSWILDIYRGNKHKTDNTTTYNIIFRKKSVKIRSIKRSFPIMRIIGILLWLKTIRQICYNWSKMTSNWKAGDWTSWGLCSNEGSGSTTPIITRQAYKMIIYMSHRENKF